MASNSPIQSMLDRILHVPLMDNRTQARIRTTQILQIVNCHCWNEFNFPLLILLCNKLHNYVVSSLYNFLANVSTNRKYCLFKYLNLVFYEQIIHTFFTLISLPSTAANTFSIFRITDTIFAITFVLAVRPPGIVSTH